MGKWILVIIRVLMVSYIISIMMINFRLARKANLTPENGGSLSNKYNNPHYQCIIDGGRSCLGWLTNLNGDKQAALDKLNLNYTFKAHLISHCIAILFIWSGHTLIPLLGFVLYYSI